MESLNNGNSIDFNQIEDYQKAAKDFSEGSIELEQLLLNCFSKGIITVACCKGHEDKLREPYISFLYNYENKQYFYALMSKLKDSGYSFGYNKLSNGKSFISIKGEQIYNSSECTTFFNNINNVINAFDKDKNYYSELPKDLQKFLSIIKSSEKDDFLKTDESYEYFQMHFGKVSDGYQYIMTTNDSIYNSIASKEGFVKGTVGMFPYYYLTVPKEEMAISNLDGVLSNIQSQTDREMENFNPFDYEGELQIEFEDDVRTLNNTLLNHLKVDFTDDLSIVAYKLIILKAKGIYAFVIFNGIELNNYKSNSPQEIVEEYYYKLKNKKYEKQLSQPNDEQYGEMKR